MNTVACGSWLVARLKRPKWASSQTFVTSPRSTFSSAALPASGTSPAIAEGLENRSTSGSAGPRSKLRARCSFTKNPRSTGASAPPASGPSWKNRRSTPITCTAASERPLRGTATTAFIINTGAAASPSAARSSASAERNKRSPPVSTASTLPRRATAVWRNVSLTESPAISAPNSTITPSAVPAITPAYDDRKNHNPRSTKEVPVMPGPPAVCRRAVHKSARFAGPGRRCG